MEKMTIALTEVEFVTGNPQMEMIYGKVHVLRPLVQAQHTPVRPIDDITGCPEYSDSPCLVDSFPGSGNDGVPATEGGPDLLPSGRTRRVAMLCIPARFVPTDLITLLGPFHAHLRAVRLLRHGAEPRQFIALMELDCQEQADSLVRAFDGRRFNSFEEASCVLAFVAKVEFGRSRQRKASSDESSAAGTPTVQSSDGDISSSSSSSSSSKEEEEDECLRVFPTLRCGFSDDHDPTPVPSAPPSPSPSVAPAPPPPPPPPQCVVCLERMDGATTSQRRSPSPSSSPTSSAAAARLESTEHDGEDGQGYEGVLTTACNHSFHLRCLVRWEDAPCPVCRYHHNLAAISSQCQGFLLVAAAAAAAAAAACGGAVAFQPNQPPESTPGGTVEAAEAAAAAATQDVVPPSSSSSSSASPLPPQPSQLSSPQVLQRCPVTSGLLVCVICGHVGCGGVSKRSSHAQQHFHDTKHAYALEIGTQQVWDFSGEGYVHRLIVSKAAARDEAHDDLRDSKLVEAVNPRRRSRVAMMEAAARRVVLGEQGGEQGGSSSSSGSGGGGSGDSGSGCGSGGDSGSYTRSSEPEHLGDALEEEMVHRELEGLSYRYNQLLAGQLEAQRRYFTEELEHLRSQRRSLRLLMPNQPPCSPPRNSSSSNSNSSGSSSGGGSSSSGRGSSGRSFGMGNGGGVGGELDDELTSELIGLEALSAAELVAALSKGKRQLEQRLEAAKRRAARVRRELDMVESLNGQLEENLGSAWAQAEKQAQDELNRVRDQTKRLVPALEKKVETLMRNLDGDSGDSGGGGGGGGDGAAAAGEEEEVGRPQTNGTLESSGENNGVGGEVENRAGEGDVDDWGVGAAGNCNAGGGTSTKKKKKKKGK